MFTFLQISYLWSPFVLCIPFHFKAVFSPRCCFPISELTWGQVSWLSVYLTSAPFWDQFQKQTTGWELAFLRIWFNLRIVCPRKSSLTYANNMASHFIKGNGWIHGTWRHFIFPSQSKEWIKMCLRMTRLHPCISTSLLRPASPLPQPFEGNRQPRLGFEFILQS